MWGAGDASTATPEQDRVAALERGMAALTERIEQVETPEAYAATFVCRECGNAAKLRPQVLAPDVIAWLVPMCTRHPMAVYMRRESA